MSENHRQGAYRGWAKRRINIAIKKMTKWLGKPPSKITVWGEDFDRVDPDDFDVELRRGPCRIGNAF